MKGKRMFALKRVSCAIAGLAIAAAGLTATTAPAQADGDDFVRFLLGAAAVAVIVHGIEESSNGNSNRHYSSRELPNQCEETYRARHNNFSVYNSRCLRNAGLRNLPRHCADTVQTDRGERRIYRTACLLDSGYSRENTHRYGNGRNGNDGGYGNGRGSNHPNRDQRLVLPSSCSLHYRENGHRVTAYYADCLRNSGLWNLPQSCSLTARGQNGRQTVYNQDCLVRSGYRAE
jgi:hypothetical protein